MGYAFICRRGGGGSSKSAIVVTAPTGCTVTATMGGIAKNAVEKNGTWTFKNCDIGTWVIHFSRGTESGTAKQIISEENHLFVYYLTVDFRLYPSDFNLASYGTKGVDYEVVRDDDTVIAPGDYRKFADWNLILLTSKTLIALKNVTVDIFVLGGGGACLSTSSGIAQRAYGGRIETHYSQEKNAGSYPIVIGAGGGAAGASGGNSSAFGITANGGISSSADVAPASTGSTAFGNQKSSKKYGGSLDVIGDAQPNSGFGSYNGKSNGKFYKGGSGIVILREAR